MFRIFIFIWSNFERLGPPSAEAQAGKVPSVAFRLLHLRLHDDVFFMVRLRMSQRRALQAGAVACLGAGRTLALWSFLLLEIT